MKYANSVYEGFEFYPACEEETNRKQKVVKTRKPHWCSMCEKDLDAGNTMLKESAFMDGLPVSSYICIDCCDKTIDEINALCGDGDAHD